jgi:hypothetical protein
MLDNSISVCVNQVSLDSFRSRFIFSFSFFDETSVFLFVQIIPPPKDERKLKKQKNSKEKSKIGRRFQIYKRG